MGILVCTLFVVCVFCAMMTNRDLMSPGKFYLASMFLFYVGALLSNTSYEVWMLILLVLLIGLMLVVLEAGVRTDNLRVERAPELVAPPEVNATLLLWSLTVPALLAQLFMIVHFGGVMGYINMIGNRVVEWRGLGWAKTLITTVTAINLVYFAVGLLRERGRGWWVGYFLHLVVVLGFGLLTGSRGSLLSVFALQLIVYHYLKRPVSMRAAVGLAAGLLVAAMILGVVRNGIRVDEGSLQTGLDSSERSVEVSAFSNGVTPLRLLLEHPDAPLAYGSTFASVVTNVIPRSIWEDKPDTGGVYFTKVYTGDAWDGTSNLTPTLLGEFVINFGWIGGVSGFLATGLLMVFLLARYYDAMLRLLSAPRSVKVATGVVLYVSVMWSAAGLLSGEVTNVVQNLVLTQLAPVLVMRKLLARA